MKTKILSISMIAAFFVVFFTSCNPNKSIYEQLDSLRTPYHESFAYTLTDADYTSIANYAKQMGTHEDSLVSNAISTYKSFSATRDISKYLPPFLSGTFKALDSNSAIQVTYKYDNKFTVPTTSIFALTDTFALATLTNQDAAFADTLLSFLPTAVKDDYALVKFKGLNTDNTVEQAFRLYIFDGVAWVHPSNAFEMRNSDYAAIGGSVGTNHDFSSSNTPEYYLPIYLKIKFPYQLANTDLYVVYDYYASSKHNYTVDRLFYNGTSWSVPQVKTSQFIHNGTAWLFDPTVYITFGSSDYQVVIDWVLSQDSIKAYADQTYKDLEYFYGFDSYHKNVNLVLATRRAIANDPNGYLTGLSDVDANTLIWNRVIEGLIKYLEIKYPTAQPMVNGVQLYFVLTINTYEPAKHINTYKIKCLGNDKFEYAEGPTTIQ